MRTKTLLLSLLCLGAVTTGQAAVATGDDPVEGEKIVIQVDNNHGGFTRSNTSGTFAATWQSTGTTPVLTLDCGVNNMSFDENKNLALYSGTAGTSTYTLSVPAGYAIEGYSFKFKGSDASVDCKVTPNGGEDIISSNSEEKQVAVTGLSSTSTSFVVYDGNNKAAMTSDFTVTVVQTGSVLPFVPTTVENGQFADATVWYTLQIGSSQHFISDNGEADRIRLTKVSTDLDAADLWCFAGDEENGFRIYNKQAGPTKVLASATSMTALSGYGGTGGSTYPTLQEADALPAGYVDCWDFAPSTSIVFEDASGYYIILHGTDYAMNNFGGIGDLAFWAEGKDQGSTFTIRFAEVTIPINSSTGEFTASNAGKTWHSAWESSTEPSVTFACGANNMQYDGESIAAYVGLYGGTYTFTAPEGYAVAGYSFDFCKAASYTENVTLTVEGTSYTPTDADQHIEVSGLGERTASFVLSGANKGIVLKNFVVVLRRYTKEAEPQFEVFPTETTAAIPYRIPAIATANNGDIIAVADYRYSRSDIGMANNGRIDLRGRISKDNGETWGDIFTIVEGKGANSPDFMNVGFGDPCIVADRESSRVLLMSCAGNVSFPNGTRNNHQCIARFYSEDNGQSWSEPEDIAESIYSQFDASANHGPVKAMFIGSGKISQSETTKVGDYYRLYCAVLLKNVNSTNTNFVLYSDDFGGSWNVLGGVENSPLPDGGDEPKAEELPDGSVLLSSRTTGGRYFNIFSFTDSEKAEGSWGTPAFSGSSNNGTTAVSNSCNGEIMIVPATRKSDGQDVFLALQSVPLGSGRANVGIYYKELESLEDFSSPENFAKEWDGRHQASYLGSAYSTMSKQANDSIAFLYEEETHCGTGGGGYTIVYKAYSIETITDSAYTYKKGGIDRDAFVAPGVNAKVEEIASKVGSYVGMLTEEGVAAIREMAEAYSENPTKSGYEAINVAVANAEKVELQSGKVYRLRNYGRAGELYLKALADNITVAALDEADEDLLFGFIINEDGTWKIMNESQGIYIGATGAVETRIPVVTSADEAVAYRVESTTDGLSALLCTAPANSYNAIHLAGDCTRLVPWSASSPAANSASYWYIEPTELSLTGIENAVEAPVAKDVKFYDLSGRRIDNPTRGIFITSDRRKVILK